MAQRKRSRSNVKYVVNLSADERESLQQLVRSGRTAVRRVTRARILLKADEGLTDAEVAAALNVGVATVHRIRQRCVEEGLEAALGSVPVRVPRPCCPAPRKRTSSRWPAASRPMAVHAGRYDSWPTAWLNSKSPSAARMKRCGAF